MREIVNLIKLDFISVRGKSLILTILLCVFTLVFGFLFAPQIAPLIAAESVFIFQPIFSIAEKSNYNRLYATLPISRRNIVIARFVESLLAITLFDLIGLCVGQLSAINGIYLKWAGNLTELTSIYKSFASSGFTVPVSAAAFFFLSVLFCTMALTIDFILGTDKEAVATILIIGIISGIVLFLKSIPEAEIIEKSIDFVVKLRTYYLGMFLALSYSSAIVIMIIGILISHLATRKREL